ncbi:hypothetical protein, partial [Mycobacterium asiaticum]|uniref:hypothetical protein n=1 Tax=Mycobacterium asiaticum TaxID=1790 RepID=UPI0020A30A4B
MKSLTVSWKNPETWLPTLPKPETTAACAASNELAFNHPDMLLPRLRMPEANSPTLPTPDALNARFCHPELPAPELKKPDELP